ncbi:MAG: ABC-2 type transporter, NodJ family [Magnetococcales bacterium]|nr:ABC-2 type transporter, NodJ family [Magnetococcales bacterium]HIJ82678.1 ABC transporter permease [Magnetococcales bacterium]
MRVIRGFIPSRGSVQVWRRHFLVWKKNAVASLAGSLGEPLLYLLGLGYGLGRFVGAIGDKNYMVYVASGILAANSMNSATFEAIYGGFTRMTRQNTFHAMLATPLTVADVVAGEIAWAATRSLISGTAIFLVGWSLGAFSLGSVLVALPVVVLAGLAFGAMAMVVTAISPSYDFFLYYFTLVTTPMFLFCGVFYPVASLPILVQAFVAVMPLTHVVALLRPEASGFVFAEVGVHLAVIGVYAVASFIAAVALVRRRIIV